jgi:deoxyribonuclease-4
MNINISLGAHINDITDIESIKSYGGNIVQLFVPSKTKNKQNEINLIKSKLVEFNVKCIVHANYSINLANDWDTHSWSIEHFINEIETASEIGANAIVVHLGKSLNLTIEEALNNMYTSLMHVHEQTKHISNVMILLETSSGQGTELCNKIEDFAYFFKKLANHPNKEIKKRFGICLDTCHIFASGYDIRKKKAIEIFLDTFEELLGIQYIKLIHLNDSKNEIGSMVDRHEQIGKGYIGKGLFHFYKYFKKINVSIILETPSDSYKKEIKNLLKF